MLESNQPYVKQYENGVLVNPINESYRSPHPNRKSRRGNTGRIFSNKKGIQLVVTGSMKYRKETQIVEGIKNDTKWNPRKNKMTPKRIYHNVES